MPELYMDNSLLDTLSGDISGVTHKNINIVFIYREIWF